jgi:dihydrofolate synthase/folylpolyglutamate synthase
MTYDFKKYDDTINYLYGLQKYGIKLGLENIKRLMDILNEPHKSFYSIHIAGTNGKGSTATMIASILNGSGFKVGLYSSPHLVSFIERIRINNQPISEPEVIEFASIIREHISQEGIKPTFFEFTTAMTFYYFAFKNVEWAVIETGMGGRFDATNVILPEVSIITNISLDHCEFLGWNISDITTEKAGIIKPGIPVITGSRSHEVIKQLSEIALNHNSEIHIYGRDFEGHLVSMNERQIVFDYSGYNSYRNLLLSLTGRHQLYNVSLAIRACEILKERGIIISETSIRRGLLNISLEGRLEWVSQAPPIIIDGAHNPQAATILADSIRELLPTKKIILIIGIMKDKDIKGILNPLIQIADSVILTKPRYERAASPEELMEEVINLQKEGINYLSSSVKMTDTIAEALEFAKSQWQKDCIILVTGSFYTIGEVKELLGYTGVLSQLRE